MIRSRICGACWLVLAFGCGDAPGPEERLIGGAGGAGAGGGGAPPTQGGAGGSPSLGGSGGFFPIGDDAGVGGRPQEYVEQNLIEFRIEPADALLAVALGHAEQLEYRAFGRYAADPDNEVELTERTV